jgi:hypothetical protein
METNQETEVQRHTFLRSVMDTAEWPYTHTHTHTHTHIFPTALLQEKNSRQPLTGTLGSCQGCSWRTGENKKLSGLYQVTKFLILQNRNHVTLTSKPVFPKIFARETPLASKNNHESSNPCAHQYRVSG